MKMLQSFGHFPYPPQPHTHTPGIHIAPLARSVDLYDNICVFIAYKSTFIVVNKSTIYVGNKSWRFIFSEFCYNIFPQLQAITKIQPIKQQILLYCTISSETTRFVDFIGKKPTNLGIIIIFITITITLILFRNNKTIIIIFTLILSSSSFSH